jgi:hypothetical protein
MISACGGLSEDRSATRSSHAERTFDQWFPDWSVLGIAIEFSLYTVRTLRSGDTFNVPGCCAVSSARMCQACDRVSPGEGMARNRRGASTPATLERDPLAVEDDMRNRQAAVRGYDLYRLCRAVRNSELR